MFERQVALEKAQGHRGLATRLFAPISNVSEAELLIREACLTLLGVAGLFAVAGVKLGIVPLLVAAGLGLPALLTLLTRARAAAAFLCVSVALTSVLYAVGAARGLWVIVLPLLLCALAVRASEATFRRHFFQRSAAAPPVECPSSGGPAV
jgi:hypothetical protein